MKKSTTRFLIAALIIAVLAYIFLYKMREKFEDDEYEGFENMVVACERACVNKKVSPNEKAKGKGLKGCISECTTLSQELKDCKMKIFNFNNTYYKFPM